MIIATGTMKAVMIHSFGGSDAMQIETAPIPKPEAGELLIRIHAAGVNPVDWKTREGKLGELPLPAILGNDFSGIVEAHGAGVRGLAIGDMARGVREGDAVFGTIVPGEADRPNGSFAEYAVARASDAALVPRGLDHIHAAATPTIGQTAWQALFDVAHLETGQTILIHAAAGGVGHLAVQFARWKGARVIGTASADNLAFVRSLGADEAIDYRAGPIDEAVRAIAPAGVDAVLDTIGGETQERSWNILRRGGILVSLVQPPSQQAAAKHGVRGVLWRRQPRGDQLAQIAQLLVHGQVRVHVEATFPLDEARQALDTVQQGHGRGKTVLEVAGER